ncbi:hypothetical protein AAG570_001860 [Ranatra chinensis]|uniref:Uncharacterized protein n=1 Tax=Ranatra chinensis TaxID=642074 RepID=A0ABD0Y9R1_9HEMI
MASKRRNMFQKNKTQETTENGRGENDWADVGGLTCPKGRLRSSSLLAGWTSAPHGFLRNRNTGQGRPASPLYRAPAPSAQIPSNIPPLAGGRAVRDWSRGVRFFFRPEFFFFPTRRHPKNVEDDVNEVDERQTPSMELGTRMETADPINSAGTLFIGLKAGRPRPNGRTALKSPEFPIFDSEAKDLERSPVKERDGKETPALACIKFQTKLENLAN